MPKTFRFRLERLLRLRRLREEQKRKQLADVRRAVREQQERIAGLFALEDMNRGDLRRARQGAIDLVDLRLLEQHGNWISRRILAEFRRLSALQRGEGEVRGEWRDAAKGVRILERLRERRRREYLVDAGREERKALDEIAQQADARREVTT